AGAPRKAGAPAGTSRALAGGGGVTKPGLLGDGSGGGSGNPPAAEDPPRRLALSYRQDAAVGGVQNRPCTPHGAAARSPEAADAPLASEPRRWSRCGIWAPCSVRAFRAVSSDIPPRTARAPVRRKKRDSVM